MKDLRLTKSGDYFDMKLDNGDFPWCYDGTQVANHGLQRLLTFHGERLANTDWGTKWYQIIFDVAVSQVEKELEIKRQILSVPGVLSIVSFEWEQSIREVTITSTVQTAWGNAVLSASVVPL